MKKQEKQEFIDYIITIYDEYLQLTKDRCISYGEILYLQNLKIKELREIEKEISHNIYDNSTECYDLKFDF